MTSVIRFVGLGCLALLASGCGPILDIFRKGPPLEQYRLVLPSTLGAGSTPIGPPVLPGTLAITPYVTRGIYDGRGIVYRVDDLQLGAQPDREWASPLSEMLGTLTQELLEHRPLTAEPAVFAPRLLRASTYQWRGSVREFEEVDRGRQVLAAVHLDVEIVRSADDSVVWRGSVRTERAVPEPTKSMTQVVSMLSSLTGEALLKLIDSARADLGAPAAGAARPPR